MPESQKEYFEAEELAQLVKEIVWEKLLPILYLKSKNILVIRYRIDPIKGVLGKNFEDFVQDAIRLFAEGKRKCPKNLKIETFFYKLIRRLIYEEVGKQYLTDSIELTEEQVLKKHSETINLTWDEAHLKQVIIEKLGGDKISIDIFECWVGGIDSPAEIRELIACSEKDYNNSRKRLLRVLQNIHQHYTK